MAAGPEEPASPMSPIGWPVLVRKRYYRRYSDDGAGDPDDTVTIYGTIYVDEPTPEAAVSRVALMIAQTRMVTPGARLTTSDPRITWEYGIYDGVQDLHDAGYEYEDLTFEVDPDAND